MKEEEKKIKNSELSQDATQYGEFISSFFSWQTPKEQRRRVEELEDLTENTQHKSNCTNESIFGEKSLTKEPAQNETKKGKENLYHTKKDKNIKIN